MSLYGSLMGDMDNDAIFGSHMRTMRQMNNMMNSLFGDPFSDFMDMRGPPADFGLAALGFPNRSTSQTALAPFGGFPAMPNINRLLSGSLDSLGNHSAHCYSSSSTVVSMSSGPDGRPHVYKASSSTRVAPGGIKETQKSVQDSRTGTQKMAIGHYIGNRAHIVEREQMGGGDQEERQEFLNIEEEEADEFNREWQTRTRGGGGRLEVPRIGGGRSGAGRYREHVGVPAIMAGPSSRRHVPHTSTVPALLAPRRQARSSASASASSRHTSSASTSRHPYSPSSHAHHKKNKNIKSVSGSPHSPDM